MLTRPDIGKMPDGDRANLSTDQAGALHDATCPTFEMTLMVP